MTAVDAVLRLHAAADGHARPRASVRHRHLDDEPMVVVVYRLAGESAAPLGVMFGTEQASATLLVAPEPRNRQIRFQEFFNPLSVALYEYIERRAEDRTMEKKWHTCTKAPQLIVPNGATSEFVGPLLGRSLRYLQTDGEFAVPEDTVLAGAHLTWLGLQAELPGSSVVMAATELLRRHWVCGISDLETEDLHVQLAWIDPPDGSTGAEAAELVQAQRFSGELAAAGPTPDPVWDSDVLAPLVAEFNERRAGADDHKKVARLGSDVRAAVEAALEPAWAATWRTIELLRGLPEGETVAERWRTDRFAFTRHADRAETGDARFRARDSVKQAAFMVSQREGAQGALEANEALDDPLVMAGAVGDGRAIAGTVLSVEKPIVELELTSPCPVPVGTLLYWADERGKCSVIVSETAAEPPYTVTLTTKAGKTKYYPEVGARAVYSPYKASQIPAPKMPADVPWTHIGPDLVEAQPEVPE